MKKVILITVALLTMASSAFAQLGSLTSDLVFTPVTPCRIVDTRFAGGQITTGATRTFKSWGASFAAQGGLASDCGIPQSTNVAALAVNLLVIAPAAEGFLKIYPSGAAVPNASILNYLPNDVLANGAVLKVSQAGTGGDWNLYSVAATHFAADVTGYYSRPVSVGSLDCVTTTLKSGSIAANSKDYLNSNACPSAYKVVSATCDTGSARGFISAGSGILGNDISLGAAYCNFENNSSSAQLGYAAATCCRIPGR